MHLRPMPHALHERVKELGTWPQSTSVSPGSSVPFAQSGGWVAEQRCVVDRQIPDEQSAGTRQALPLSHFGQTVPPQSVAVSSWSRMPFVHDGGATQRCALEQVKLAQSFAMRQAFPLAHGKQVEPPQSMAVSVPSRMPFLHGSMMDRSGCERSTGTEKSSGTKRSATRDESTATVMSPDVEIRRVGEVEAVMSGAREAHAEVGDGSDERARLRQGGRGVRRSQWPRVATSTPSKNHTPHHTRW